MIRGEADDIVDGAIRNRDGDGGVSSFITGSRYKEFTAPRTHPVGVQKTNSALAMRRNFRNET